jgi:cell wall-associated NlpC family hydrolase
MLNKQKFLKGFVFLLVFIITLSISNKVIEAKVTNTVRYTYTNNKKVKTKLVTKKNGKKLLETDYYTYNNKGQYATLCISKFGKNNKLLTKFNYKYVNKKTVVQNRSYYYDTFLKTKTPLNKTFQINYYNAKGKFIRTKYLTKAGQEKAIVALVKKQNGKAYRTGGKGPSGFDCSGLTSYVYQKALGKNIGRATYNQVKRGKFVPLSTKSLKPGDILFWGSKSSPYHVGIYIGGGRYVHASTPRTGVETRSFKYFKPSFAKRMI